MSRSSSDLQQKSSFQIKQDDKFFIKLMSKENSMSNPSFRISGSVPFGWESRPGTPKHVLIDSSLPPLTPPPSYYCFDPNHQKPIKKFSRSNLVDTLFKRITSKKIKNAVSSSCVSSNSEMVFTTSPTLKYQGRSRLNPRSAFDDSGRDYDQEVVMGSPASNLCFGIIRCSRGS